MYCNTIKTLDYSVKLLTPLSLSGTKRPFGLVFLEGIPNMERYKHDNRRWAFEVVWQDNGKFVCDSFLRPGQHWCSTAFKLEYVSVWLSLSPTLPLKYLCLVDHLLYHGWFIHFMWTVICVLCLLCKLLKPLPEES